MTRNIWLAVVCGSGAFFLVSGWPALQGLRTHNASGDRSVADAPLTDTADVDPETQRLRQRFREVQETCRSATTAYYQIMQWNSVAMQYATLAGGGGDRHWAATTRRPPGVDETLARLPLVGLADEVGRLTEEERIPAEDRQHLAELWKLYSDLKNVVDDPRHYYGREHNYGTLTARFERIVQNKPATVARFEKTVEHERPVATGEDPFRRHAEERLAAAQSAIARYEQELRRIQSEGEQNVKRLAEERLETEWRVKNRQFERSLIDLSPQAKGEALVWRAKKLLAAAQDAFGNGYARLGEDLLWNATDAATRASKINSTRRSGEFAVRQIIEFQDALSRSAATRARATGNDGHTLTITPGYDGRNRPQ